MTPVPVLLAIGSTAVGVVVSVGGFIVSQTTGTDSLAPYVSGGGAAMAVAGLVYIAKKLASGELVAVPIADVLHQQEERERQLFEVLEDNRSREDTYRAFLVGRSKP